MFALTERCSYGLDPKLPNDTFNRSFLETAWLKNGLVYSNVVKAVNFTGALWVGETALAWQVKRLTIAWTRLTDSCRHSGENGTTNAFRSGPWWIYQVLWRA
jgi:hypothetical protein